VKDLGNKLLLYVICSCLLGIIGLSPVTIAAFVISLAGSSLYTYSGNNRFAPIIIWVYSILILFFPAFGLYLPLFLYDGWREDKRIAFPPMVIAGAYSITWIPRELILPFFLISLISVLLSFYCSKIDSLQRDLHQTQDDTKETTIALSERNQALIAKQDSEIHAATLAERNRIAREIHDNVGHMLTRSILQTGALKVINKDPALEEPLATLHNTLNTAMTSIRTSVHDLHDDSVDLKCTLLDIITPVEQPDIRLEYDIAKPVTRDIKYTFIAIVKEAVNNMQKHSNATSAHIILREHPGFFHLQIEDNGTNIQPNSDSGIGLNNMKERVLALGGTIRFSTDNGFSIYITIYKKEH